MKATDIARHRLYFQHIAGTNFKDPQKVVSWMGAMQAQDYNMAKWAVGIRLKDSTDQLIEYYLNEGKILRTHLLRPTWHMVSAEDIYWILELTAPHIKPSMRARHRELGLTDKIVTQTKSVVEKALSGGIHLTREELLGKLQEAKLVTDRAQLTHLMMICELDRLVCSGASKGKKQTYALLEERVKKTQPLSREEALAKLAKKYFESHGPATIQDFIWWSGLPVKDARSALEMVKQHFASEEIESQVYWFAENGISSPSLENTVHLIPAYDEYIISYRDRTATIQAENHKKAISENGFFRPVVVVNGETIGTWKRLTQKDGSIVELNYFQSVTETTDKQIEREVIKYGQFINQKIGVEKIQK
ncbi:MAG: winged helix DNA-binding domain-containing protein [Prolixibacteraceae bacterium]|jgi:hypothetical protein